MMLILTAVSGFVFLRVMVTFCLFSTFRPCPLTHSRANPTLLPAPAANPSSASVLKLCGNFMILTAMEMCAEAFALAEAHSVDRSVAYDLLADHRAGGPPET